MDSISTKKMPEKSSVEEMGLVWPIELPHDAPRLRQEETRAEEAVSELVDDMISKYGVVCMKRLF